jgi:hypothetical protein
MAMLQSSRSRFRTAFQDYYRTRNRPMFRLLSFIKRSADVDRQTFVRRWTGELSERVCANPSFKRSVRSYVVNLPFETIPKEHLWIACDDFDGAAEFWFDDLPAAVVTGNALATDPAIAAAAGEIIDAGASVSWIGAMIDDFDLAPIAVKRMVAGQAREGMLLEEAQDYWLHEHGAFFKSYKEFVAYMLRYRQQYGIATPGLKMKSYKLMAMEADVGFRSLQDLSDAYREPNQQRDAASDLAKFGASSGAITFTAASAEVLYGQPRG